MWSLAARDHASLREVSGAVHDAYIDGPAEHDDAAGVVEIPIAQEGFEGGPVSEQFATRETWRYREHLVTFFRGRLIIRRVRAMHKPDGWDDQPMIESVELDEQANQVTVLAGDRLRLTVDGIDVEVQVSGEPGGHVRRRVGKLTGIVGDRWLDQHRA
jgi:hypothetical protein